MCSSVLMIFNFSTLMLNLIFDHLCFLLFTYVFDAWMRTSSQQCYQTTGYLHAFHHLEVGSCVAGVFISSLKTSLNWFRFSFSVVIICFKYARSSMILDIPISLPFIWLLFPANIDIQYWKSLGEYSGSSTIFWIWSAISSTSSLLSTLFQLCPTLHRLKFYWSILLSSPFFVLLDLTTYSMDATRYTWLQIWWIWNIYSRHE